MTEDTAGDAQYTAPPRHHLTTLGGTLGVLASLPFVVAGAHQILAPAERAADAAIRLDLTLAAARNAVIAVGVAELLLAVWALGLGIAVLRRRPAARLAAVLTYVGFGAVGVPIAVYGVREGVAAAWIGLLAGILGLVAAGALSRDEVATDVERGGFEREQRRAGRRAEGARRAEQASAP